jgi:hypothetical protein
VIFIHAKIIDGTLVVLTKNVGGGVPRGWASVEAHVDNDWFLT